MNYLEELKKEFKEIIDPEYKIPMTKASEFRIFLKLKNMFDRFGLQDLQYNINFCYESQSLNLNPIRKIDEFVFYVLGQE